MATDSVVISGIHGNDNVIGQLSHDVIGYIDSKYNWCLANDIAA